MKIEKVTKDIKAGTILKDSDGCFIIQGYNKKFGWYDYIECNEAGIITNKSLDGALTPQELVGAEIIK